MTAKAKGSEKGIVIPELDAIAKSYIPHTKYWSEREIAIVEKYYPITPIEELMKHLPGRSKHAIQSRASELGLRKR